MASTQSLKNIKKYTAYRPVETLPPFQEKSRERVAKREYEHESSFHQKKISVGSLPQQVSPIPLIIVSGFIILLCNWSAAFLGLHLARVQDPYYTAYTLYAVSPQVLFFECAGFSGLFFLVAMMGKVKQSQQLLSLTGIQEFRPWIPQASGQVAHKQLNVGAANIRLRVFTSQNIYRGFVLTLVAISPLVNMAVLALLLTENHYLRQKTILQSRQITAQFLRTQYRFFSLWGFTQFLLFLLLVCGWIFIHHQPQLHYGNVWILAIVFCVYSIGFFVYIYREQHQSRQLQKRYSWT